MKKFWEDFKKFITRGNVVDMAVGVAVATAFTAIVTAFTKGFITPLLALLSPFASDLTDMKWIIRPEEVSIVDGVETIVNAEVALMWGAFVQKIIDFLIIAFALFLVMRIVSAVMSYSKKIRERAMAALNAKKIEEEAALAEEARLAEEAAAAEEAEKARIAEETRLREIEEEKARLRREEELLTEIRDLLRAQQAK